MLRLFAVVPIGIMLSAAGSGGAAPEPKKDPNELICKQQKRTGTRFPTRICHTRKQWGEISEGNKRAYSETRDRPVIDISRNN